MPIQNKNTYCPDIFKSDDWEYYGDQGDNLFYCDLYRNKVTGMFAEDCEGIISYYSQQEYFLLYPNSKIEKVPNLPEDKVSPEIRLYDNNGFKFFASIDLDVFKQSIIRNVEEIINNDGGAGCGINYAISRAISEATQNKDLIGREINYAKMEIDFRKKW